MTSVQTDKKTVMLIAFYNIKALGVRYLETALRTEGYNVVTCFYKGFNSVEPKPTTSQELKLLREQINKHNPVLIGLSVMSSMYLDTVNALISDLSELNIPLVAGGAYASMFPEYFLERNVDYVIRADGEAPLRQLTDAIVQDQSVQSIPSLCYKMDNKIVINDIGDIAGNIDEYGVPTIKSENAFYIENDILKEGDPQLGVRSYEVIASRGCPFTCSYCCCINLRRLFPENTPYVRTRTVQSVMEELIHAKKLMKKLVFIHFYDEIFPNTPGWVDEFIVEYKKHINMPFTIWSHPKMVDAEMLKKLVSVGLCEVIMGIQSGSEHIRKDVFHRNETQNDIINATKAIISSGVKWATYDFMLQHPFESLEDLIETYKLVKKLYPPYELQLHGLNFLPGTDIVSMAIEEGYYTEEELHNIMYAPLQDQFDAYWNGGQTVEHQLWFKLIYCLQFKNISKKIEKFAENPSNFQEEINKYYQKAVNMSKLRYYYKKSSIVAKRLLMG